MQETDRTSPISGQSNRDSLLLFVPGHFLTDTVEEPGIVPFDAPFHDGLPDALELIEIGRRAPVFPACDGGLACLGDLSESHLRQAEQFVADVSDRVHASVHILLCIKLQAEIFSYEFYRLIY